MFPAPRSLWSLWGSLILRVNIYYLFVGSASFRVLISFLALCTALIPWFSVQFCRFQLLWSNTTHNLYFMGFVWPLVPGRNNLSLWILLMCCFLSCSVCSPTEEKYRFTLKLSFPLKKFSLFIIRYFKFTSKIASRV